MAKFTVLFNNAPIQTHTYDQGIIHIGRDDTNDIKIDSLAVALAHAVIILTDDHCMIRYLNDSFPLFVNEEKTKEHPLLNGDKIGIGKHTIIFNSEEFMATEVEQFGSKSFDLDINTKTGNDAYLQVISGKHIGRIISLKQAMTKIGQPGKGVAIISKRKEGYFVSALENHPVMAVNDKPLGDNTIQLKTNDKVQLEGMIMQFYTE